MVVTTKGHDNEKDGGNKKDNSKKAAQLDFYAPSATSA